MNRLTLTNALKTLSNEPEPYVELFRHGSMSVELYKPIQLDDQEPHTQDEVYVVASGSGCFVNGDSRRPFETDEVLFVAAGVEHRFEDFSDDFSTWVIFYGLEGGENGDP